MVTPENGTITFLGLSSGTTGSVDIYSSDVVAAAVTFNKNGAAVAGSDNYVTFGENVKIIDISIATGQTVGVGAVFKLDGAKQSTAIRWANQLNTLNNRPPLNFVVRAGQRFQMEQF